MFLCEFVATTNPHRHRCRRCGFEDRFACPPGRVRRACGVVDLREPRDRSRPCIHLGEQLGLADCRTCRGRVRVKTFACALFGTTTLDNCRVCSKFESAGVWECRSAGVEEGHSRTPVPPHSPSLLLRFPHGFGDAVQLTTVLLHLRELHPEWRIDVASKPGAHTLFRGLCRAAHVLGDEPGGYDLVRTLHWHEPDQTYADSPATKAEKCLREVFDIAPLPRLCRYEIHPDDAARRRAREYVREIVERLETGGWRLEEERKKRPKAGDCRLKEDQDAAMQHNDAPTFSPLFLQPPAYSLQPVLIHYQGNSARRNKNLDERDVAALCQAILARGGVPVVLDWDGRSGLVDQRQVFSPGANHPLWGGGGSGDGATLAALAELAAWCVGIDSGPGHLFGATRTPTTIVWTKHHPLHFYGLADNVTHLVPLDHAELLRGDREQGLAYFERNYRYRTYRNLAATLTKLARCRLHAPRDLFCSLHAPREESAAITPATASPCSIVVTSPPALHHAERDAYIEEHITDGDHFVRREHHAADMMIVRDVYLDDCYRVCELPTPPRYVIDVGAHIGAFASRLHARTHRAAIACVEANPANIETLRANVGSFAEVVPAACSYEPGPVELISTVFPGSANTGGSTVAQQGDDSWRSLPNHDEYRPAGQIAKVTLEELMDRFGFPRIDLLKLDCEGSEFSILEHCDLSRIGRIVGEYHDRRRFKLLVARRFAGWKLRFLTQDTPGLFWLWR